MRKFVREINFALSGLKFATWISNMEEIEQMLVTKGSIWSLERQWSIFNPLKPEPQKPCIAPSKPGRVYKGFVRLPKEGKSA